MSHRPLHRVLGETSLELKCLTLFGAFLLLVVTASFLSYWLATERVVTKQDVISGQLLAHQFMLTTHWKAWEQDPENPDFVQVVENFAGNLRKQEFDAAFVVPDAKAGKNLQPADEFERALLDRLAKRPAEGPEASRAADYAEHPDPPPEKYVYFQAVYAQKNCLTSICHRAVTPGVPGFEPAGPFYGRSGPGGVPWSVGDLMAVVRVTIPNGPVQREISWYWNTLLAVAIFTAFLAMIAFYVTIRYLIVKPLKHLRDVSDAISRGNIALRADLHTGDEFEALGLAFNRMLRHLVAIQDELRQVNADLDGKVDELAQANMQLYEMNRIKSDFLATMSHELRTPLNSILGFSDVLCSIPTLDEKQRRYVENIRKSGRMLLDMINNILDLAKMESGGMDVRPVEFRIEDVVAAQCDFARPDVEKKNIDLTAEIEPGLPPMLQDQNRIQQILNNLLSNAVKFTPEGGRIRVTVHRNERGDLVLRVIDTGVGIAEEDQQVIFEKFRQGRTALPGGDAMTREYSGTGLGLSIVKELCKLLDGEVSVESELGTGSTFTVRLPWKLERQPRLESPASLNLERYGKARLDAPNP
jgi:signal transduction histidine kinase